MLHPSQLCCCFLGARGLTDGGVRGHDMVIGGGEILWGIIVQDYNNETVCDESRGKVV